VPILILSISAIPRFRIRIRIGVGFFLMRTPYSGYQCPSNVPSFFTLLLNANIILLTLKDNATLFSQNVVKIELSYLKYVPHYNGAMY